MARTASFGRIIVLSAAAALAMFLAWAPFGFGPLVVVAPVLLAHAARTARSARALFVAVAVTQLALWLWVDRWMAPISALGLPFMASYMATWPLFFVALVRRAPQRWPMVIVVPVAWCGLEFARGQIFMDGYPWYLLAHAFIEWPVAVQTADLLGTYFTSFLVALAVGAGLDWMCRARWRGASVAVIAALWLVSLAYGAWRLSQDRASDGPSILVIQTNLPQSNKIAWTFEAQKADFNEFARQTVDAVRDARAAGHEIDLIAWPETMLPGFGIEPANEAFLLREGYVPGDVFSGGIRRLQDAIGVPMLVGSAVLEGLGVAEDGKFTWDRQYNSAYLVDGEPPYPRVDKRVLTPFGETMPYISNWPWLEQQILSLGAQGMSFGIDSGAQIVRPSIETPRGTFRFGVPICFEATVPWACRQMIGEAAAKDADILVNLTNDGWFTDFDAIRVHHARIARFRCIENRVPMVRVVNTGMSLSIDSCGRLTGGIGDGRYGQGRRAGHALFRPRPDDREPLYRHVGDTWGWMTLAAAAILVLAGFGRRRLDELEIDRK